MRNIKLKTETSQLSSERPAKNKTSARLTLFPSDILPPTVTAVVGNKRNNYVRINLPPMAELLTMVDDELLTAEISRRLADRKVKIEDVI